MGRKVHPIGFRLGIIKDWQSRWFADRNYTEQLHEDIKLRSLVAKKLANASISRVDLERSAANQIEITLSTAKPGIVIGKGGQAVEVLRKEFETLTGKKVKLNINEIKQPEIDAYLVAESIADQITRRVSYKRAMKQAIMRAMRLGAKGIRVRLSGRLGGAEMARVISEREGRVPLQTLRADIDYGQIHAHTTYGRVGVKVWIYRGDVIGPRPISTDNFADGEMGGRRDRGPRPERNDRGDRRPAGPAQGQGRPQGDRRPAGERGPRPEGAGDSRATQERPAVAGPEQETAFAQAMPEMAMTYAAQEQGDATQPQATMPAAQEAAPAESYVATEASGESSEAAADMGMTPAPTTNEAAGSETDNPAAEAGTPAADEVVPTGEES